MSCFFNNFKVIKSNYGKTLVSTKHFFFLKDLYLNYCEDFQGIVGVDSVKQEAVSRELRSCL